jgi:hypothetical protein
MVGCSWFASRGEKLPATMSAAAAGLGGSDELVPQQCIQPLYALPPLHPPLPPPDNIHVSNRAQLQRPADMT